ncbi:NADPH-dependent diflavin oxidoreductase 1 [Belonocnema kinseyi]|uniref:NADPH-dependent diflavin oxidoreductase 1 n=1 Tax=Belonocnema kinseyi TaxID=2817044 RepID=UPI00143D80DF|nr:NADPH-dependent diflavin oxidoreductase 1 [Belonocnema kinseyi]
MKMNVTILYGSETGTAQDTAEQIWKSAKRNNLKCSVSSMDEYNITNLLFEKLVIFVVSTTGQGEPPTNMKRFWKFLLRKNLPTNSLIRLKYAVLGLGDSSYQKFNFAAKKLNKRLAQLGAIELIPIGLADDQHDLGIDAVVNSWVQNLWTQFSETFSIPITSILNFENPVIQRFQINLLMNPKIERNSEITDIYARETLINESVKVGTVLENRRTTADDHFQDVRLIKLKTPGVEYTPGDVLYIRPKNSEEQVRKFFKVLNDNDVNLDPDAIIRVSEKEIKVPSVLQQDLKLHEIVEQYWDLNFKPRRSTIQTLAFISDNELEKEKLIEFTTAAGQEELFSYVNRPRRTIVEVFADFPNTTRKLSLEVLFEIMSPIKARAFSIASSLEANRDETEILVAVVKYKTKLVEPRLGLCSNWLARLKGGDSVIYWIQRGTFKFDWVKPMILIGPGTGVAPFRSLMMEKGRVDGHLKDCLLFFGCRNREKDYHCREDFEKLARDYHLRIFCAFSRDQEEKVYVQHVIRQQGKLCWEFVSNGANIYLAGSSKNMPNSVREEFVSLAKNFGKMNEEEAEKFINLLEKNNRYQTETWE